MESDKEKDNKKRKLRLLTQTVLKTYNEKIQMDTHILESLLTIDLYESEYTKDELEEILQFYEEIIKHVDLSEVSWEDVVLNSKMDVDNILYDAISKILINGEYTRENRLNISNNTLYRVLFDEWTFCDKFTGIVDHFFVPKFNFFPICNVDLSNINFDNVIFDVKEFFKKYLAHREKYEIIFSPDNDIILDDMQLPPLEFDTSDEDYLEGLDEEFDEEYDESFDPDYEDMDNYDSKIFYCDESYEEDDRIIRDPDLIGYTEEMIENSNDYYIDLSNTNAKINFKTNLFGYYSDVNFMGTDLSESHLEECDGIHIEYCNLGNTGAKLPIDRSNIINCSFERSI